MNRGALPPSNPNQDGVRQRRPQQAENLKEGKLQTNKSSRTVEWVILKGNLPTGYGKHVLEIFIARVKSLFEREPSKEEIKERHEHLLTEARQWRDRNKELILKAVRDGSTKTVLVPLPDRYISLAEAIEAGYIQVNTDNETVTLKIPKIKGIDPDLLSTECKREFLVSCCITIVKYIVAMTLLSSTSPSLATLLFCALLVGFAKGSSKYISDTILREKCRSAFTEKINIETFAETMAQIASIMVGTLRPAIANPLFNSSIKGPLGDLYKKWNDGRLDFASKTEVVMNLLKAGHKAASRIVLVYLLSTFIFQSDFINFFLGNIFGSLFSVVTINIFVDQYAL